MFRPKYDYLKNDFRLFKITISAPKNWRGEDAKTIFVGAETIRRLYPFFYARVQLAND